MSISEEQFFCERILEFFDGKSIFLTGACGYLGMVLLETLLRRCPGIQSVYILVRSKNGKDPENRKESLFKKKLFDALKEENPCALQKVHVLAGDISLPSLGMSESDYLLVCQDVTIVFHCAAIVSFVKPLSYMLMQNSVSTDRVIELCRKLKKLDVFVFTSTAFSNCNRNSEIMEKVYRLPFHSQDFLDELRCGNFENVERLFSECMPLWPNAYTFSKCLAENIVMDKASDLPVAIIRPSIIASVWKSPLPGYIEDSSGISALSIGTGKGFIKVLHGDPNTRMNIIPSDVVANTHIVAAWSVGTCRSPSSLVVNCTSFNYITLEKYCYIMAEMARINPLPKSFQILTNPRVIPNGMWYKCVSAFHHYIPAIMIDLGLSIYGKKLRLLPLYQFYDKAMDAVTFFLATSWNFQTENMKRLKELLHPEDKKLFYIDPTNVTLEDLAYDIPNAAPFYDWNIDSKTIEQRRKIVKQRYWLVTAIQWFVTLLSLCIIYMVVRIVLSLKDFVNK